MQQLLAVEPDNPNFLILKGTVLVRMGKHPEAMRIYERVLKDYPNQARAQMNYGHTLKTVGRLDEAIALADHKPESCLILQRPQAEAPLIKGRDSDWAEAIHASCAGTASWRSPARSRRMWQAGRSEA